MIKLGQEVKDVVSGFKGIVIARSEYLNGCIRVGVQPKIDKDGKFIGEVWFDEGQLKVISKKKISINNQNIRNQNIGGPYPSPKNIKNPLIY